MPENLLSQPFDDTVKGALEARLGVHLRAKGQSGDGGDLRNQPSAGAHARRLNAWCTITKKSGQSISMNTGGFEERYPEGAKRKPTNPSLKKVTINRVTTYAERINLTLEILVEFEVYTYDVFQTYARDFLRRPEQGEPLTITFGHVPIPNDGRGIANCSITDVWVIGGGYTQEGSKWVCTFKAIAPASAVLIVDMSQNSVAIPKGLFFKAKLPGRDKVQLVRSLHEYILYALQINGSKLTEQLSDGQEVSVKGGFTNPIGKVYKRFEGSPVETTSLLQRLVGGGKKSVIGVDTGAVEYISLKFVVELVNKFVLEPANKKHSGLELKIELLPDSISYVPGRFFKSGNPIDVLFLSGKKGGSGTYHADGDTSTGKDFEIGGKYFGGCVQGYTCYHDKILLSRRVVIGPLIDAIKRIDEEKAKNDKQGKTTDPNSFLSRIITVGTFFDNIFRAIQTASGSYVSLCWTHLKDGYTGGKKTHILRIDNCSYVSRVTPVEQVHKLRPITGDGNTLSMTITGKLPDNMVGLAIVSASGPGSDTAGQTANDDGGDPRKTQFNEVLNSLSSKSVSSEPPGVFAKLAESNFSEADISAACMALQACKDLAGPSGWDGKNKGGGWTEYFDVEMSAEMEGAFPIIVGNRITAEGLPSFLTVSNQLAFVILDISDTIEAPGIWTTAVKARLCHL